jgi:bifunctional non-homologous end joining protein LigD
MPLTRARGPFSHSDWVFELKWDGFRAVSYIDNGGCKLMSRKGNEFRSFPSLTKSITSALRSRSAVLDGEIVCLDETASRSSVIYCSAVANPALLLSTFSG